MKWYNSLTIKYLKENRRRTIVTIIGIILSISLICGVTTLMESYKAMERQDVLEESGYVHATFMEVKKDNIDYITKDSRVKESGIQISIGDIDMPNGNEAGNLMAYNKEAFDFIKLSLMEGRYPENADEVVLSEDLLDVMEKKCKVGDKIKLNIGEEIPRDEGREKREFDLREQKEYTVTGITKYSYLSRLRAITYADSSTIENSKEVNVPVIFNKVKNIYEFAPQIAEQAKMQKVDYGTGEEEYPIIYNESLLRLEGESKYQGINDSIEGIVAMVIGLVIVVTVATIYNAFNISLIERKKQFGILSSLGATDRQIRRLVIREAFLMGIVAIPFGVLIGTLGVRLLFNIVMSIANLNILKDNNIEIVYSFKAIALGVIISIVTIYLSALLPARKASKLSPIDAIRSSGEFKVKKVRKNILISKIFGVEGELAYKNLKRNRKKYRVTLFSLTISIIIFLTFTGYINLALKSDEMYRTRTEEDFSISTKGKIPDYIIDEISNIKSIKSFCIDNELWTNVKVEKDKANTDLPSEIKESYFSEDENNLDARIIAIGNKNLSKLKLNQGKFNVDEANKENGVILINNNRFLMPGKRIEMPLTSYKVGDTINIYDHTSNGDIKKQVKIMGILNEAPEGINLDSGAIKLIATDEFVNEIKDFAGQYITTNYKVAIMSKDIEATRSELKSLLEKNEDLGLYLYDANEEEKESKNLYNMMLTFVYTFIFIISMISISNVINTIGTNFRLRRREFAMIQSIGITPKSFNKMTYLESIYYSLFAMLYGVPISLGLSYLMYKNMSAVFQFDFVYPYWAIALAGVVMLIVSFVSVYMPKKKMERESIIDNIRDENI